MSESTNPTFTVDGDGVGWIVFDDPERPLNVLDEATMRAFADRLDEARAACRDGRVRVVVVRSGKSGSFIAGADVDAIAEIEDPAEAERTIRLGQAIYNDVETLPAPTIAAVHGVCVGGGVEMSLACTYRVCSDADKTTFSLPEVLLGILPAWGGTTRLPRTVGLQAALDMLLTGKKVRASKAKRIGLVSDVYPAELFDDKVRDFALRVAADPDAGEPRKRSLVTKLLDDTPIGRPIVLKTARKKVMATTGGHYPAPLRILDVLKENLGKSVDRSLAAEARAAAGLIVGPVCKNLVHVFQMREAARKGKGLGADLSDAPVVKTLGVLGAGVMGGGIAQLAAYNDVHVYMKDIDHGAVGGGLKHARSLFDKQVKRRRMTKLEAAQHMERIGGGIAYHGLSTADVVVEAIVEKMEIKKTVIGETEKHVPERCVIATNTSSLSVTEMATALERPERFCGMHFFNPVHKMPLIEVIRAPRTSDQAVLTVYALAVRMGKVPVVVGDGPGFLVNRILGPYLNEAGYLLGEGGTVEQIDRVAKEFGMPMGPLRLIDEVGIDVSRHAGESLHAGLGDRLAPSPVLIALANTDRLGRKGGRGFYLYEDGKEQEIDETIYDDLGSVLAPQTELPDEQIRDRLVVSMINEAARILDDGIVSAAEDVDLAMIMGTGFPPFRGGLLRFADTLHAKMLLETVRKLEEAHGPRFAPAPLIERLAEEDRGFYDAFPGAR